MTLEQELAELEIRHAQILKDIEAEKLKKNPPKVKPFIDAKGRIDMKVLHEHVYTLRSEGCSISLEGGWVVECIENTSESSGSDPHIILEIRNNGNTHSYWKVPGYLSSYDRGEFEWDDIFQVVGTTRQVTVWEPI